jgi:hypothetical protein
MRSFILLILATLLLGALCAGTGGYLLRDIPPPDDADLRWHPRPPIPDDENAATYFDRAYEKFGLTDDEMDRIGKMLRDDTWDDALAQKLLDDPNGAFAELEKGLACKEIRLPPCLSYDTLIGYLSHWRRLGSGVMLARCRIHQKAQREEEAFREARNIHRLGYMATGHGASPVHILFGVALQSMARKEVEKMVASTATPWSVWRKRLAEIKNDLITRDIAARALQVAYEANRNSADRYSSTMPQLRKRLPDYFYFQKHRTYSLFADLARDLMGNLNRPKTEWTWSPEPLPSQLIAELPPQEQLRVIARGNIAGRMHVQMICLGVYQYLNIIFAHQARFKILALSIELRAYAADHGDYPETLDQLIPDYLSELPLDPFDNKPLRYSKERKAIYSIGSDLQDCPKLREKGLDYKQEPTLSLE